MMFTTIVVVFLFLRDWRTEAGWIIFIGMSTNVASENIFICRIKKKTNDHIHNSCLQVQSLTTRGSLTDKIEFNVVNNVNID